MIINNDIKYANLNSTTGLSSVNEKTIIPSRKTDEKDIYEKYRDITFGTLETYFETLIFKQFTNPTKSKYDNVIGWVKFR